MQNVWAPEIHHDAQAGHYLIVWSSTIAGRFPETAQGGDERQGGRLNHRLYSTTTKDFVTYTPARLFYDNGFSVIDGVVVHDGTRAVLVMKDEARYPQPRKHVKVATADRLDGPYAKHPPRSRPTGWRTPPCSAWATRGGSTTTSTRGRGTAQWTRATSARSRR